MAYEPELYCSITYFVEACEVKKENLTNLMDWLSRIDKLHAVFTIPSFELEGTVYNVPFKGTDGALAIVCNNKTYINGDTPDKNDTINNFVVASIGDYIINYKDTISVMDSKTFHSWYAKSDNDTSIKADENA